MSALIEQPNKKYLRVIFTRSHTPGSMVIRTMTWSSWAHCGIVTPEGTVIEARAFATVGERRVEDLQSHASKWTERLIEVPDPDAGIAWARTQIGKPYDYRGIAAFVGRNESWQDEDSWFCSELVEAAIAHAGRTRFLLQANRITPQMVWMTT